MLWICVLWRTTLLPVNSLFFSLRESCLFNTVLSSESNTAVVRFTEMLLCQNVNIKHAQCCLYGQASNSYFVSDFSFRKKKKLKAFSSTFIKVLLSVSI